MTPLTKATLEQIVTELRRRKHLIFALVVLRMGDDINPRIIASPQLNPLETTQLLMAGAQDIVECLVDDPRVCGAEDADSASILSIDHFRIPS